MKFKTFHCTHRVQHQHQSSKGVVHPLYTVQGWDTGTSVAAHIWCGWYNADMLQGIPVEVSTTTHTAWMSDMHAMSDKVNHEADTMEARAHIVCKRLAADLRGEDVSLQARVGSGNRHGFVLGATCEPAQIDMKLQIKLGLGIYCGGAMQLGINEMASCRQCCKADQCRPRLQSKLY
jgi:hypothetical protein